MHPDDFELRLFAAEPDIGKSLAMSWDARGRLWLCETVDYPNELAPEGKGRDRIRICEDTDGDGRADKFTVFAEQLSIPTTLAFHRGGVIVQNATETLYLRDTDGDDKADVRKVLLTGWAAGDTHGGVSNFRYGLDNWYWAMQGYNNSTPTRPASEKHPAKEFGTFRMGFFRFRLSNEDDPIVTDLEFIRSTNNNTWGLGISEEGLIFGSTANGNPSEFMPIPNRYYEAVRGWSAPTLGGIAADNYFDAVTENVRQVDHHGGFTAAAGHALYTARNYPQAYWNRTAFVCEPTGHLVATFVLEPHGAGFRSRNAWNLVASDDEWAAPVMAEVGPDGNVWVLDWYNYIIQHNPTPVGFQTGKGNAYETELRDKRHGRVFRVVPKGWKEEKSRSLAGAVPDAYVEMLRNKNMFWRLEAQRLLVERDKLDVQRNFANLLYVVKESAPPDEIGLHAPSIHSLWTMHGLGAMATPNDIYGRGSAQHALSFSASPGVHRNAALVLAGRSEYFDVLMNQFISYEAKSVRLAALLALAESPMPNDSAGVWMSQLFHALAERENVADPLIVAGCTFVAARNDEAFLSALATTTDEPMTSASSNAVLIEVVTRVAEHFARGAEKKTPLPLGEDARRAGEGRAAVSLAQGAKAGDASGGPLIRPSGTFSRAGEKEVNTVSREGEKGASDVRSLLVALSTSKSPYVPAIVEGLARGWPKDAAVALDAKTEEAIVTLLKNLPRGSQGRLVSLAERLGSKRMVEYGAEITFALLAEAADAKLDDERRLAAARQAVEFRKTDEGVAVALLKLLTPRTSPELAGGLLQALAGGEVDALGRLVVEKLPVITPAARKEAVRLLLAREAWTPALLNSLEKGTLGVGELALDQKQALATHPNKQLQGRAKKLLASSGGLPNPDRQRVLDELQSLTEHKADAAAGKLVFVKQCAKCHMHSGEGQKIGPDLTGMAVHPKRELLVHLIDPNRSVEGNFREYSAVTDDGRVLTGLLAGESKTAIEIVDAETKKAYDAAARTDRRAHGVDQVADARGLREAGEQGRYCRTCSEFLTATGEISSRSICAAATVVSTKGDVLRRRVDRRTTRVSRLVAEDVRRRAVYARRSARRTDAERGAAQ